MTGFAMTEPEAGTDVASLRTTAHRDGSDWVIDGEKHLISNAGIADVYVVFAATSPGAGSRGISAFLVSSDAPGFTFAGAQAMAAPHPLGRLRFERCRVPGDALLGEADRGFRLGMATLDRLRPTVGAAACGMAARALDEAVRHAATRRQFGQLLGDRQLIREKLGRMATELAAARLLVYHAAWRKDCGAERISTEAAMAKSYATEAAQRIVDEAVQILGGSGVLLGNPVERLYRAVRALRIYEGATEIQRLIIGGGVSEGAVGRVTKALDIVCVGGGPGALYFALLMKRADSRHRIRVLERNAANDTFGFGVVFSDATMAGIADADSEAYACIARHLVHWDDIDIHYRGEVLRSTGHGFSGMSRHTLLHVLQQQAHASGVELSFESEVAALDQFAEADLIVGGDGVNSTVRGLVATRIESTIDVRPNRFVWLGTAKPFPAFTFYFKRDHHGLWRVHAYQYGPERSTFIVECRDETWRSAGLDNASEEETRLFLERLFAEELEGHALSTNRSIWRQFPTIQTRPWSAGRVVLIGDAAHTAHFSVGSGTRLAMEDAVALRTALVSALGSAEPSIPEALRAYEQARRPQVESLQRAAQASLEWFEETERYVCQEPLQFAFTLLTRSLRITHEDLRARDSQFLARVDAAVAEEAAEQTGSTIVGVTPPPMFTPFRIRDLIIPNRVVVSPMCQYVAADGNVADWHLVHLGSRAIGGAGLVMAEMTDVSAEGRISPWCAGLYDPQHAGAWKRVVDFVHRESPAKIGIQLGHAGRKGATQRLWEGDNEPLAEGGWPLVSASPIPYFRDRSPVPREMTAADMRQAIDDFTSATNLADEAGFDLLEIHMAHGYLLASFISPLTNKRTDDYGGTLENRMRFPLAVFDACRQAWPAHKPMSVRISAVDWVPGGMSPADAAEVAIMLKAHGCDIIDVSAGQTVPDQQPVYGRLFQTPFSDRIRHEVGIATMAVGNISSYMDANTIIAAGRADLCVLARAHLFDPYWTRHAAWMLKYPLPWPDPYRSVERYNPRFEFHFSGDRS